MSKTAVLCLSHYEGGMELDSIKQTALFNRHSLDSVLICRKNTFLEKMANEKQIPTFSIDFKAKLSWSLIRGLRKIIIEQSISTLVFFGTSEIKSIYFAVKGLNCRVIVRHGTTMSSPKKDPIHRLFYSCASDFVGISQHLENNAIDIFPCKPAQVHTVYNSSNTSTQYTCRPKQKSFVHVGRVDEGKGVFDAIKALGKANIASELKKISFVGRESKAGTIQELTTLAKQVGVHAEFLGFQSNPNQFYLENRYLLFPSHGEGLPNVILEALHHGLICITYDNTVFPEIKGLGFNSFYTAKDRDINSLTEAIEQSISEDASDECDKQQELFEHVFSDKNHIEHWKKLLSPCGSSQE